MIYPKWMLAVLGLLIIAGAINLWLNDIIVAVFCFVLFPVLLGGEVIFQASNKKKERVDNYSL